MDLRALIATAGGLGRLPVAPGTWGSLGALPLGWVLHGLGGFPLLAAATAALLVAGLWAAPALLTAAAPDPSEVVIDEVVGQLIALWPLSLGLWLGGAAPWLFPWPGWVGGFILFRLFDILKPPPIRRIEALPGAWGVMLDDVAAGFAAAAVVAVAAALAHGPLA